MKTKHDLEIELNKINLLLVEFGFINHQDWSLSRRIEAAFNYYDDRINNLEFQYRNYSVNMMKGEND